MVQTLSYTNQTADQLYLDFKTYHGLTSFSRNCVCLASASPPKQLVLGVARTNKSNVTYNYVNIIWVPDYAFTNWNKAREWIQEIQNKVTWHGCVIDLISELIENFNAQSKTAIEVNELLTKDWDHFGINKKEKKTLHKGLGPYVKAGKAMSKRCASCLKLIKQT